jgi:hypothetical protein
VVPAGIDQLFVPGASDDGGVYQPIVLGGARVRFTDARLGIGEERQVLYAALVSDGPVSLDWADARRLDIDVRNLTREPEPNTRFGPVPDPALKPKNYEAWQRSFGKRLAESETLELLSCPELKLTSRPGEAERDFKIRVKDAQREARDKAIDAIRKKYAPKERQLAEQQRRAEAARAREAGQASHAHLQTAVSMGATILGMVLGRRARSSTLGRATTTARGMGRSMKEAEDIKRATENVEALQQREAALQEEVAAELQQITDRFSGEPGIEQISLMPKRGQVTVQFVSLGWYRGQISIFGNSDVGRT